MTCTANRHGATYTAYNKWRCRCAGAREAKFRYEKRRLAGINPPAYVDPTGTVRRLQALAAIGWSLRTVMQQLGWSPTSAPSGHLLNVDRLVHRSTAERVREVYDRLSMTPGPSNHARNRARAKGWLPPLAWDDETIDDPDQRVAHSSTSLSFVDPVAVERALTGDRVRLTRAERAEVVRRIIERGQGVARVCQLLPVSNATAQRLVNDARRETRVSSAKVAS